MKHVNANEIVIAPKENEKESVSEIAQKKNAIEQNVNVNAKEKRKCARNVRVANEHHPNNHRALINKNKYVVSINEIFFHLNFSKIAEFFFKKKIFNQNPMKISGAFEPRNGS